MNKCTPCLIFIQNIKEINKNNISFACTMTNRNYLASYDTYLLLEVYLNIYGCCIYFYVMIPIAGRALLAIPSKLQMFQSKTEHRKMFCNRNCNKTRLIFPSFVSYSPMSAE